MRRFKVGSLDLLGFIGVLLILLALPGLAAEPKHVQLEISSLAPRPVVERVQTKATGDWLLSVYAGLPESGREEVESLTIDRVPSGVAIRFQVKDPAVEPTVTDYFRRSLALLAEAEAGGYSYQIVVPEQEPSARWAWIAPMILLVVLAFLALWWFRPRFFLSVPFYRGLPILGLIPGDLGRGGKFLELQGLPCQAMGLFIRQAARRASNGLREIVILGLDDLNSSAIVASCLGLALLREAGRVLIVDLAGEDSPLAEILEEGNEPEDWSYEGMLRETAIPDLDLLTGLAPLGQERPPLPIELLERYRWVLYHAPTRHALRGSDTMLVASGQMATGVSLWKGALSVRFLGSKVLGAVLVGAQVPQRLRDQYMARYYFEKIRAAEAG